MVSQLTTNRLFVALLLQYCRNLKELYFSGLSANGMCNIGLVLNATQQCTGNGERTMNGRGTVH